MRVCMYVNLGMSFKRASIHSGDGKSQAEVKIDPLCWSNKLLDQVHVYMYVANIHTYMWVGGLKLEWASGYAVKCLY